MRRGNLVNGVAPNGFYGVGNMLVELAEYHDNNRLNIGGIERYTQDGEKLSMLFITSLDIEVIMSHLL